MSLLMDALKKAEQAKAKSNVEDMAKTAQGEESPAEQESIPTLALGAAPESGALGETESLTLNDIEEESEPTAQEATSRELELSLDDVEAVEPDFLAAPETPPAEQENHVAEKDVTEEVIPPSEVQSETVEESASVEKLDDSVVEESVATPEKKEVPPPVPQSVPVPPKTNVAAQAVPAQAAEPEKEEKVAAPKKAPLAIGKPKVNRTYLWAGVVTLLAMIGIGYYIMAVLESTKSTSIVAPGMSDWQREEIVTEEPVVAVSVSSPEPTEVETKPVAPVPTKPQTVTPKAITTKVPPKPAVKSTAKPKQQVELRDTQRPLTIQRTEVEDPIYRVLQQAYGKYETGDLVEADRLYRLVLQRENTNRDALLGMAVIAQKQSRLADARTLYGRLLTLNPKDSVASSGLMSLSQQGEMNKISQLKMMLSEEPTAAHLYYSLGNEYSSQSAWSEAQQAYFNAYRYAPNNGDYAYNLAVSLERIAQPRAAIDYYRRALEAPTDKRWSFDRAVVSGRIELLQQTGGR